MSNLNNRPHWPVEQFSQSMSLKLQCYKPKHWPGQQELKLSFMHRQLADSESWFGSKCQLPANKYHSTQETSQEFPDIMRE